MKAENGKDDARGILRGSDGLLTLTESQWRKVRELEIRVITLAARNFATTAVLEQLLEMNREGCLQRLNVMLLLLDIVDRLLKVPLQTMTRDYVQQLVAEQFRNWNKDSQLFESWTRSEPAELPVDNEMEQESVKIAERLDDLLEQLSQDIKTLKGIERRSVPKATIRHIFPLLTDGDGPSRTWALKQLREVSR